MTSIQRLLSSTPSVDTTASLQSAQLALDEIKDLYDPQDATPVPDEAFLLQLVVEDFAELLDRLNDFRFAQSVAQGVNIQDITLASVVEVNCA